MEEEYRRWNKEVQLAALKLELDPVLCECNLQGKRNCWEDYVNEILLLYLYLHGVDLVLLPDWNGVMCAEEGLSSLPFRDLAVVARTMPQGSNQATGDLPLPQGAKCRLEMEEEWLGLLAVRRRRTMGTRIPWACWQRAYNNFSSSCNYDEKDRNQSC